ncbi:MAG: hypothetical protein P0Y56_13735 [Candidatus Andeanibacterium colombiense]|uniref:Uncharacterized protein n=1 Tax=Candidatus Andeanibacterium colombiense TaxID=3121345 RepID=A0AAJ6BMG1_9SPHN|nr:MAG: hypothetical protein P0Y56_13735 [Sphingomonadaceae bacterium]
MTHTAKVAPRRFAGRIPPFLPVPLRDRHNGWTAVRQGEFIGFLAETGSVSAALREVGMSRQSAYELRKRPGAEGFAAAWDAALGKPFRKVTGEDLVRLAYGGMVRPIMRGGRYCGTSIKPNASALLRLMDRLDRAVLREQGLDGG